MIAARLLDRARAGDEDAFAELTDPFRPELQVHCYRIVGSVQGRGGSRAFPDTGVFAAFGLPRRCHRSKHLGEGRVADERSENRRHSCD